MSEILPIPKIDNWRSLYAPGARARCIKDDPPMYGFGRSLKAGEIVSVQSVCWRGGQYEIGVPEECAFYRLEGYFEVETERQGGDDA